VTLGFCPSPIQLLVYGKQSVNDLPAALSDVSDVDAVHVNDANAIGE
jgi:hypothetical protein